MKNTSTTMAIMKWICSNNTKNMFVKIVHPGGHVELHDRPILASEVVHRNPKCCVARPDVFQHPWAIVSPETTLLPGQKFYVVSISTIRKLQMLSLRSSMSQQNGQNYTDDNNNNTNNNNSRNEEQGTGEANDDSKTCIMVSHCWSFMNAKSSYNQKTAYSNLKQTDVTDDEGRYMKEGERNGDCLDDFCFTCLLSGGNRVKSSREDSAKLMEPNTSPRSFDPSETKKNNRDGSSGQQTGESPRRSITFLDQWQPSLESIIEEL